MSETIQPCALRPASALRGLSPYRPVAASPRRGLRLDANEGPAPAEALLKVLAGVSGEGLRCYPDAGELESVIARRWGVDAERVVVTAGGDDAIARLCRAMLEPGRSLVTHQPTFEMIGLDARLAGATIAATRWLEGPAPVGAMAAAIDGTTGLVAVVSPNNPTGAVASVSEVRALAHAARRVGAALLADLAYVEFAHADPTAGLLELDNVVVVRTLSKAFGLAGLRVGYAIAPRELAGWLRTTGGPYPVSGLSLAIARAALDADKEGMERFVARVRVERAQLATRLGAFGARVLPSQANFVSAFVPGALGFRDRLQDMGISIRAFTGGGDLAELIRITLPGEATAFARVLDAVDQIEETRP
jgi:histidinol-phosphate aminotransferase